MSRKHECIAMLLAGGQGSRLGCSHYIHIHIACRN